MLSANLLSREAAERFVLLEGRYADESRYDEWLALWTEDAVYWVPANLDDYDPNDRVSIIYDDRERLQDRIDRLKSGGAWAQEPKSRLRRIIGNIEAEEPTGDSITVRSSFVLGELRRGRQTTYFADQIHRIRSTNDGLRMVYKKVILLNNDEPLHNMSFII